MTVERTSVSKIHVLRVASLLMAGSSIGALAMPAYAQEDQAPANPQAESEEQDPENAILVEGIRATIQSSIQEKRKNDLIYDALSSEEIGDLPALSIGEALETLTGASSHREQGGASEIALRGLGPFLSSTTINGRLASNGSGDRSVNFSQFPSELFDKIGIYKTQSASLIEGGVAGQIALESVQPLDYGKRRIQGEFKLNYNPDNFNIASDQRARDLGYRGTVSYVDQFRVGAGELGISVGYSRNVTTNPEQESRSSSFFETCRNDPTNTNAGVFDDGNCDGAAGNLDLIVDPATGVAPDADTPFVLVPSSRAFRQNITDDERDSLFAAFQYRPSDRFEISADFQYSNRIFEEDRHDLVFAENRRIDGVGDINRLDFDLIVGDNGEVLQFTNEQRIESISEFLSRSEEYYGGGASIKWQANDRLRFSLDASYSETRRIEIGIETRLQSEGSDIFGNPVPFAPGLESDGTVRTDRPETATLIGQNGSQIANFVVQEFDVNNFDLFADQARTRFDLEQDRFNSIWAGRGDLEYALDKGIFTTLQAGVRFQELQYRDVPGAANGTSRLENTFSDDALTAANQACRIAFPETGFLSSVSGGNALVTTVDTNGNVIGTTNTFATFDPLCLARELEAFDPSGFETDETGLVIVPDGSFDSIQNNDVREQTWAGYIQANFNGDLGSLPVRGNVGVRVINTQVISTGFRGTLSASFNDANELTITEDAGSLVEVSGGGSYTEFLPSLNLTADVGPNLLARFGVYRALSRPEPSSLGFGRSFNTVIDNDGEATTIEDAIGTATALGNPFTDPLLSWNVDVALEWYPNEDTILGGGFYYKSFDGGFENTSQIEQFQVDDQTLDTIVTTTNVAGDSSTIVGFELTAAHRFSYLPGPLDGLGFKLSYNYADSNFEFEDGNLGASNLIAPDGSVIQRLGVVPPSEIFGFSKHVLSAQLYYQSGGFSFQGVYKYRSQYFQQFISTPERIRLIGNTGVFEARMSYKINKNIRLSLEAINLFDEPRRQFIATDSNISERNVFGPRIFAGVRFKF